MRNVLCFVLVFTLSLAVACQSDDNDKTANNNYQNDSDSTRPPGPYGTDSQLPPGPDGTDPNVPPNPNGTDDTSANNPDSNTGVDDNGIYFQAGDWQGYAWTDIGPTEGGTVSELSADWVSGAGSVCINGTLVADYSSLGIVGMAVAQPRGSSTYGAWSPAGHSGVRVDIAKNLSTNIRMELLTAAGDAYCYDSLPAGGVDLTWSDFATECWGTDGNRYDGTAPIERVQIYAPGDANTVVEYDFCIHAMHPISGSGTDPNPDTDTGASCNEADREVCGNATGTHCGYSYEFWSDRSGDCMTLKSGGNFYMAWSGSDSNVLARKGRRPGTGNEVVTFSAPQYTSNGNSYLGIYGWMKNVPVASPGDLVEYYIIENWIDYNPTGGGAQSHGTFQTADGATYALATSTRTNMPSIEGDRTFIQYWSVRNSKRSSGTVNVAEHFTAWKNAGLPLGDLYEVSFVVEGYHSTGSGDVVMTMR